MKKLFGEIHIENKIELFKFTFESMTSPCEVLIYEKDKNKAFECFEEIKKETFLLEKKYNFYNKDSYLNKVINNRKRNKISIDNQTYNILYTIKDLSEQTNSIFDITVGTINHWYKKNTIKELDECLLSFKYMYGSSSWFLKDKKLHFKDKETKLDLGGVIKEYAVDVAVMIIKDFNIEAALVNFGGDIYAHGLKPDNSSFSIGIKNPKKTDENLLIVNISNQALTTSASYERYKTVEDKEFSHIINKNKIEHNILSSTIISSSTLESGILSTSFMINPSCEIRDEIQVVLIDEDLSIHQNLVEKI